MSKRISEYRSEVIEKFINIEWLINAIISQYYLKRVDKSFLFDILYDVNCFFALKRNVLQKIAPSFSKLEDLNRLSNIRNYFAHCGQEVFPGSKKPEPGERGKVLDPKDTKRELDFQSLYNEFKSKESDVTKELANLLVSLGGKLFK